MPSPAQEKQKHCAKCQIYKPTNEFRVNSRYKDGLQSYCKVCLTEASRVSNRKHSVKRAEYNRQWKQRNAEKVKQSHKQWVLSNVERRRMLGIRGHAKQRGLEYSLPDELAMDLLTDVCYYCHGNPVGIDRVDNGRGYIEGNVVSCCKRCNTWKSNSSMSSFENHIRRIAVVVGA